MAIALPRLARGDIEQRFEHGDQPFDIGLRANQMRRNRFVGARRQRPGEPSIEMHQRGSYLVRHLVRGFAIRLDQPYLPRNRRHAMRGQLVARSEEHTSQLQSLMRISYADIRTKKTNTTKQK